MSTTKPSLTRRQLLAALGVAAGSPLSLAHSEASQGAAGGTRGARAADPIKRPGRGKHLIEAFDYEGVRLLPGRMKDQVEQIREFYMSLSPDDLLIGFRRRAGHAAPGKELGGFYSVDSSPFAQWLSGLARIYKVTGNVAVRDRAVYLMNEWADMIEEDGFFGLHKEQMDHYTYDKFVGGMIDMYQFAEAPNALDFLAKMTTWAEKNLERSNEYALPSEWYTLSENLYRAYELTGERRYREFAKVWEYPEYWDAFARKEDIFRVLHKAKQHKSYHGYSHVNSLSSAAMAYRITGERHYLDTLVNAYDFLRDTQLFATGGYAPEEQFIVPNGMPETLVGLKRGASDVDVRYHFETSCGSWAGFKLGRYLMQFTGEARNGDWIERLVYNGVGAVLPTDERGMIMYGSCYHTHGAQKSRFTTWFCCQGSLLHTVADYHNLIYFHDAKNLYVNLFVPSEVQWQGPQGKVTVTQEGKFPEADSMSLRLKVQKKSRFGLKFRVPTWAEKGIEATVNGQAVTWNAMPGTWAVLEREWRDGDVVKLRFGLSIRTEPLPGYVSPVALLCGPVVMVMSTVRDSEGGQPFEGPLKYPADWIGTGADASWLEIGTHARLHKERGNTTQQLRPFYEIKAGEYYRMYFERHGKRRIAYRELEFEGDWLTTEGGRHSRQAGASFQVEFTGSALVWEGLRRPDAGIATVIIDGKEMGDVDQYGFGDVHVSRLDQREVPFRWSKAGLAPGKHVLKVLVTGRKNPLSADAAINVSGLSSYV